MLLVFFISACGQEEVSTAYDAAGVATSGGTLVSASIGEPANLVPFLAGDSASSAIGGLIYNSLLKYDKNLNLVGDLAEKWDVAPDNLAITFTLKQGVVFADGTPLTSADVLATFNVLIDPNTRTPYAGDYQKVVEASAPTPHTFKVTYDAPFAPALASWAGLIVLPKHIIDQTEDFNETTLKETPLGSGPYALTQWRRGQDISVTARPEYFAGAAPIKVRRTRLIPDQDTQFLELKNKAIDTMGLTPVQYTRLTGKPNFTNHFAKYAYLGNGYTYLGFNLQREIFKDVRVRQALSYATPREQIVRGLLHGEGLPIASVFKPGTWAHNNNLKPWPYDVAKARKLLAEAGWEDRNDDGILDKDGQPFRFTLVTNQGNALRGQTAVVLQQEFAKIGVEMTIRVQEWSTFLENTIRPRNFDAYILGWSLSAEPDPYDIWHSSKTKPAEFNIVSFNNKRADELMEKARSTFNQAERKKYLDEFQEIIHAEQPYLFLYAPNSLVAMHKRIKGVEAAPAGLGHNTEEWYIPAQQRLYHNRLQQ